MENADFPNHIAIIMDGNGRWAKMRGLPRIMGYRQGAKAVRRIIEAARELGVKILTLYTFSVDNWKRPKEEIRSLMKMLVEYLQKQTDQLVKNNIKLNVIGDIAGLPLYVQKALKKALSLTQHNTGLIVNLALNYSGRSEIVDALKRIARQIKKGYVRISDIDERLFSRYLYTQEIPDPDLLIRTSGEQRISNFLLWQISYTELYFTEVLWPDFTRKDLEDAILNYKKRDRRFGAY